ncbi:MAG: DUF6599 family protein [Acidobacteriota bacterium]
MSRLLILIGSAALACSAAVAAAQAAPAHPAPPQGTNVTTIELPPAPRPLLPDAFDGWIQQGKPTLTRDPAQADPASVAALKEYGFSYAEIASYKRDADETLTMRALRFEDTSGAYGAYSFYRQNGWPREDIGAGAASDKNRVLFWKGDSMVDAVFSRVGPMTAGELRRVAAHFPIPAGNRALPPPILAFLPTANLDQQTTHYAEGPAGYAGGDGVLPPSLIAFDKSAETVTASYSLTSGPATLTIVEYPTPQIAMAQEAAIRKYIQAGSNAQPPWTKALTDSDRASLEVRRSGLLVALVSGDAIPDESHRLVEMVHYEATLTNIPQPVESEVQKTSKLLLGIAGIVIVGSLAAILLGFFLGGGRAMWRIAHGKPASSMYDEEFIHLDLRQDRGERQKAIHEPHPKG